MTLTAALGCLCCTSSCIDCLQPGDPVDYPILKVEVLDAQTLERLAGASVLARPFVDGVPIQFQTQASFVSPGSPVLPSTDGNGPAIASLTNGARVQCAGPLGPPVAPRDFPPPDQVEVTVGRDVCSDTFLIDINADTVVDLNFPDNVLELRDPILVPPCGG